MRLEVLEHERVIAWRSADGNWVWAFVLRQDGKRTRLISRNRFRLQTLVARAGMLPMEPGSLVMERKMLFGIKQRAERLALVPEPGRPVAAGIAEAAFRPADDKRSTPSDSGRVVRPVSLPRAYRDAERVAGMETRCMEGPSLELRGLRRSFGDLVAVNDLSFSVAAGQLFGFVGRNGAGKTTTMRIICGLLEADAGTRHVGRRADRRARS